ncbi:MAG: tRNA (adenosine(37)-N6)-threonylcarbamoyltransferase complex dimerization subunit type 1 TsaB [Oscillospiraceae bacterium]|jgi:tRNA threonylcarbamoyladenosine biosynthesis protein TsaB|nr:tRNA (adenosine(37)-N6)-threonylcarbamoyltransferase complex dimerization subunit type 1 TsaB [Oscillospiraceae bacterium]
MTILGIDSSATAASAAVIEDGKLLSEAFLNIGLTHSQTLMPLIADTLARANKTPQDIDLVAVTTGPGSFTGIRIGVATAKGLAQPLSIPCFGISTLECIAYPLLGAGNTLAVAVMDARCEQVYCALFRSEAGKQTRLTEDSAEKLADLQTTLHGYDGQKILIGDGTGIAFAYLKEQVAHISPAPPLIRHQRAACAAFLAEHKITVEQQSPVSAELLAPTYLRAPQAERELRKPQNKT